MRALHGRARDWRMEEMRGLDARKMRAPHGRFG